jgi:predicted transcriptional regulator
MSESATLTLRLPSETKEQLALLANRTRRTSSFAAAEAIATYVTRELAIVEATEQGRAEIRAGKFTSHEDVAREAQILIKAARAKR